MSPYPLSRKIFDTLLVEDNPGDVLLFSECLKNSKVPRRLHVTKDGEETLSFLERGGNFQDSPRPDLIIMDLSIPGVDGLELLEQVKSNPQLRQIPVIILTGSDAERDISRSYDLHANCYVVKPAELQELAAMVEAIVHFWLEIVVFPSILDEDKNIEN